MGVTVSTMTPTAFLSRERTVAGHRFNRWLVPPAALAEEKKIADDTHQHLVADVGALAVQARQSGAVLAAWMAVWIPLGYGVWRTLETATKLFK